MRKPLPTLVLLLCAGMLGFGGFTLFRLRFEAGDVYPPYSSLRADPLGTMAFYESLDQMPGMTVRRDYHQGNQLPEERDTTYLHLAASRFDWTQIPAELEREINGFLGRSGRLVITFAPETTGRSGWFTASRPVPVKTPPTKGTPNPNNPANPAQKQGPKGGTSTDADSKGPPPVLLTTRWGVDFAFIALSQDESATYKPVEVINRSQLPLPRTLDWHSGLVFTNLDATWQTIYARGTNPVVVERSFGRGTVVMATDSYFLSNEALHRERHAAWLAWVIGSGRQVVFDEAHLGILETSGVAMLMRKYRLEAVAAGLLLLAGLFIWKNSLSFVPPYPAEESQGYVTGKEASAGFVNLLRRNLAPRDMLGICFSEWTKSLGHGNTYPLARVDAAQALIEAENARPPGARDPVRAYREVCKVLQGRRE